MSTEPSGWHIPQWTRGDRLRKARQGTGMSTREFADVLGVSQATVTNAENDHRRIRTLTLRAWAMASAIPVEWLDTGAEPGGPGGGEQWAPWGSNPQPTGYEYPQVRPALRVA